MDLSIVISLYNEDESLRELVEWIDRAIAQSPIAGIEYEILMIDDGSDDGSWNTIKELSVTNPHIRAYSFRRNYGKSAALQTGFREAAGDVVITMDADLQDSPDEIPALYRMIREDGYDLVSGWKKVRHDNTFTKNIPSKIYNFTARKVTGLKLHDMNCGLKAYRSEVVKEIEVYGDMHRYIPYIAKNAGFTRIGEKVVVHRKRKYGKSKFGMSRFFNGFLDLMTIWFLSGFGKKPMHIFGVWGIHRQGRLPGRRAALPSSHRPAPLLPRVSGYPRRSHALSHRLSRGVGIKEQCHAQRVQNQGFGRIKKDITFISGSALPYNTAPEAPLELRFGSRSSLYIADYQTDVISAFSRIYSGCVSLLSGGGMHCCGGCGCRLRSGVLVQLGDLVKVLVVLLLSDDVARAVEDYTYLYAKLGSLEVSGEIGIGLEIDDILNIDISLHMSPDITALGENLTLDIGGLAYDKFALAIHCTFEGTVDADVRRRCHDTGNLGALGYPAQLVGLRDYFCFCHNITVFTVFTDVCTHREMPRRPPLWPRS